MNNDVLQVNSKPHDTVGEEAHPTVSTYVKIALILAVITLIEVGVFYIKFDRTAFIILFVFLSGIKFAIVIMFYMHLKFDHALFSKLFLGGLTIAAGALFALLALFHILVE